LEKKVGLLDFKYDCFGVFADRLRNDGMYTVNVGDNIQSIAVRSIFAQLDLDDDCIVNINRDDLPNYAGPSASLVTNGVFLEANFPLPQQITPLFVGLHVEEAIVRNQKSYFKQFEPIGCRDIATRDLLRAYGIEAFTSGCLTMTLPRRMPEPNRTKVFIVYGDQGRPSEEFLSLIPDDLMANAEFIFQRMPVEVFPLTDKEVQQANNMAYGLLKRYRDEAALVITSLLHAASPCVAMGIPVILVRQDLNNRFTALSKIIPIYTPTNYTSINWKPRPKNVETIKYHMVELVKCLIETGSSRDNKHAKALDDIFSAE
jgi:Polysaccharide pyruvyl transferase